MFHSGRRPNRGTQGSVPRGSISKYLISPDLSPENQIRYIKRLLADREEQVGAKALEPDGASRFVELLDQVLKANALDEKDRSPCVRYLARLCGWHGILPKSMRVLDPQRVSELYGGPRSAVWVGKHNRSKVVIKVIKFYGSYDERKRRELTMVFCKEVVIWKYLVHPNVLPFIGAVMAVDPGRERYEIVSEFMENGDIGTFVKGNRSANRLKLLRDVAAGLSYLHSQSVVHGDIKGPNVLITHDKRACLADFGLTRILAEFTSSGPDESRGTIVWMSPEMLRPEEFNLKDAKPTKASDVYALGILMYEVMCGHRPHPRLGEWAAAEALQQQNFPPKPAVGFTDSLWETLGGCWQRQRELRPTADVVMRKLDETSRI